MANQTQAKLVGYDPHMIKLKNKKDEVFIDSAEKENWLEPMNRSARRHAKKVMGFDKLPEPKIQPIRKK